MGCLPPINWCRISSMRMFSVSVFMVCASNPTFWALTKSFYLHLYSYFLFIQIPTSSVSTNHVSSISYAWYLTSPHFLASEIPSYPLPPKKRLPTCVYQPHIRLILWQIPMLVGWGPMFVHNKIKSQQLLVQSTLFVGPILFHLATTRGFPHHFPFYAQSVYCLKMVD